MQVSVGSLVSTFAHLPSSSGEHSCRGLPGLQPGGEPAAQRPGPRCGPLGWRHCGRDGRTPAAVTTSPWHAVHHSILRLQPCPLSFPKRSEGTGNHSTWAVSVGGTPAPTTNPRKHSQLGLNLATGYLDISDRKPPSATECDYIQPLRTNLSGCGSRWVRKKPMFVLGTGPSARCIGKTGLAAPAAGVGRERGAGATVDHSPQVGLCVQSNIAAGPAV